MGLQIVIFFQRYLKQTSDATKEAHRRASPVDNLGIKLSTSD